MEKTMTDAFEKAFSQLNEKQKEAVVNFDGPMMVIAGPGTGKTQLLAIRIGQILKNTDTQAHNILALTYTDAGAIAMRQRLLQFIGPDAYKVNIYTFHAFCAAVIRDNIEYFGGYRNLQAVSDLELVEILRGIIDNFDYDHILKRLRGDIYHDQTRLKNLFNTIKKEGWSKEEIHKAIEIEIEEFHEDPNNRYKRKYREFNKGDLKVKELEKLEQKHKMLLAGVDEFQHYEASLARNERFDYDDMILWVIRAFRENPDLLLDYQERFHYLLVDEYQDTNGSQNDLLFLLASYWPSPNLFVVGDDDQSIYRFQGASMGNLLDFQKKYEPEVIVLQNNYRSTQNILESSKRLIENNNQRLVKLAGLEKNLLRSRSDNQEELQVDIIRYYNTVHEEKDIVDKIIKLHESGYDLSKVAVIYRKHSNVETIVKYLDSIHIPVQLRKEVNVLETSEISRILTMFNYFNEESNKIHSAEDLLFKILHYEYFGLKAIDIAMLSLYCSRRTDDRDDDRHWRSVLNNLELLKTIGLKDPEKIYDTMQKFEQCALDLVNDTPQVFFEKMFTSLGIIDTIMSSSECTWRMQLLNSFFNFIKEETSKDFTVTIKDLLEKIKIMEEANISLKLVRITYSKKGVNFTTIHSSKGLEYDIVFLIKGDKNNWKPRSKNSSFAIPSNLVSATTEDIEEDDRRLFYVAMTRARNQLHISYSAGNEEGKDMEPCSFIVELESDTDAHQFVALSDERITEFKAQLLRFQQGKIQLLDENLIQKEIEHFTLSATGLNKYLKCPLTYYFENILRVPAARNKYNGFGSAMHLALELFFIKMKDNPDFALPPKSYLLKCYEEALLKYRSHFTKREHSDLIVYGKENLGAYYDTYSSSWTLAKDFHLEMKIKDVAHEGIPINGMIDRVMVHEDGVRVYDYKTGSYSNASKKLKPPLGDDDPGGDYWRQIVFYSLLIREYPHKQWKFNEGVMSFLEAKDDKFIEKKFQISDMEQKIVSEQIKETHKGIMNQDFHGCQEADCRWCSFVSSHSVDEEI